MQTFAEILRKATELSLNPEVRISEPNMLMEGEGASAVENPEALRGARTFQVGCGPAPVQLSITRWDRQELQARIEHPDGELIVVEIAGEVTGPWTLLTNFTRVQSGAFTVPTGTANVFVRATHR